MFTSSAKQILDSLSSVCKAKHAREKKAATFVTKNISQRFNITMLIVLEIAAIFQRLPEKQTLNIWKPGIEEVACKLQHESDNPMKHLALAQNHPDIELSAVVVSW